MHWLWIGSKKAAEGGHALAQNNLGARYYSGDGLEVDILTAYLWFYRAAAQHDRKAAKNRDSVFRQLSEEQKARARERLGPDLVPEAGMGVRIVDGSSANKPNAPKYLEILR